MHAPDTISVPAVHTSMGWRNLVRSVTIILPIVLLFIARGVRLAAAKTIDEQTRAREDHPQPLRQIHIIPEESLSKKADTPFIGTQHTHGRSYAAHRSRAWPYPRCRNRIRGDQPQYMEQRPPYACVSEWPDIFRWWGIHRDESSSMADRKRALCHSVGLASRPSRCLPHVFPDCSPISAKSRDLHCNCPPRRIGPCTKRHRISKPLIRPQSTGNLS